jgi:Concanavalin A-like lectin/glucanases superfamily/Glycine rich protein
MFVVASMTSTTAASNVYGRMISLAASGNVDYNNLSSALFIRYNNSQSIYGYRNSAPLSSSAITYSVPFVGTCYFDGSSNYTYANGTVGTAVAATGSFSYSLYNIGRTAGSSLVVDSVFLGNISEVIVYNTLLTTFQRQQVEQYLGSKWGITGKATTFSYTGAAQTYTVPLGVNQLNVYLWGAGGQGNPDRIYSTYGAAGAMVQGTINVTAGQTITVVVGGGGIDARANTYGGGGHGFYVDLWYGGAGGGRSAIQLVSGTDYVTAAGGGGAGGGSKGGAGGLTTGSVGGTSPGGDGGGGTQTAGGQGGGQVGGPNAAGHPGVNGSLYTGGNGSIDSYAGGGGGGYYGGGGGGYGGGGGGSSLLSNLSLIPGTSVFGYVSSDGNLAPNTTSIYYANGAGKGGSNVSGSGNGYANPGSNGLVVIVPVILPSTPIFNQPFQPTSVQGCALWLDSADTSTTLGPTTAMTQWSDKSGNSRNLTSNTGSTLYSAGQYVQLNSSIMSVSSKVDLTNVTWIILAQAPTAGQFNQPAFSAFGNVSGQANYQSTCGFGLYLDTNSPVKYRVYGQYNSGAAGASISNSTTAIQSQCIIVNTISSTGSINSYVNGVLSASSASATRTTPAYGFTIGGEGYLGSLATYTTSVKINEIVVYNSVLNDGQRQQVEGYLAQKWKIASSLPTTHPFYKSIPYSISPGVSTYTPQVFLSGAYYTPGSTTWADQSPNGRNATRNLGTSQNGGLANSVYLDGSTDWTLADLGVSATWTCIVWSKISSIGSGCVLTQRYTGGAIALIVGQGGGGATSSAFSLYAPGWVGGTALGMTSSVMTCYTGVWDGVYLNTYINGVLYGSVNTGGLSTTNSGNAYKIGSRWDTDSAITGYIGEIRVYTQAFTAAEVLADYNYVNKAGLGRRV